MDADRFDAIARTLGTTRRSTLHLLAGGALGGLLALLGHGEATAACRQVGKPCTRSGQCCTGARCKRGKCRCKTTHVPCVGTTSTICCLNGADCVLLFGSPICTFGSKLPGTTCDPALPGECRTGQCGCRQANPPDDCTCRDADCAVPGRLCESTADCCRDHCGLASDTCGGSTRCCGLEGASCTNDCDCCSLSRVCRGGTCCVAEFVGCFSSAQCCGELICSNNKCLRP